MKLRQLDGMTGMLVNGAATLVRSRHFVVVGRSMEPTLRPRQHVQTRPVSGRPVDWPALRGSIVAFRHPTSPARVYLKRIVGLPREHILLEGGLVIINGAPLPEPYLLPGTPSRQRGARQWFAGDDEYFLLGDNRTDSEDSRHFGPVPESLIIGRIWFSYWPIKVWPRAN